MLAKMLAGMIEPTSGELLIDDHPRIARLICRKPTYSGITFAVPVTESTSTYFADPDLPCALIPICEPEQRRKQIVETMRMQGLLPDHVSAYPHMLAPGQKQQFGPGPSAGFYALKSLSRTKPASLDMSMRSRSSSI